MVALRLSRAGRPAVQLRRLLVAAASAGTGFLLLSCFGYALNHPEQADAAALRLAWCVVPLAATVYFALAVARTDRGTRPRPALSTVGLGPGRLMAISALTTALSCTLGSMLALLVFLHLRGDLARMPFKGAAADFLAAGQPLPIPATLTLLALVPAIASTTVALTLRPKDPHPATPLPRKYGRFGAYGHSVARETFGTYGRFGARLGRGPKGSRAAEGAEGGGRESRHSGFSGAAGGPAGKADDGERASRQSGGGRATAGPAGEADEGVPESRRPAGTHATDEPVGKADDGEAENHQTAGSRATNEPDDGERESLQADGSRATDESARQAEHGEAESLQPAGSRAAGVAAAPGPKQGGTPSAPGSATNPEPPAPGTGPTPETPTPGTAPAPEPPTQSTAPTPEPPTPDADWTDVTPRPPKDAPVGLPWGIALLATGLAVQAYAERSTLAVLAGWLLTATGLVLAAPGLTHLCGKLLQCTRPGALRLLAGRVLMAEATRIGRPLGVVCAVASAGYAMTTLYTGSAPAFGPLTTLGALLVTGCTLATLLTAAVETRQCRAETTAALLRLGARAAMLRAAAALRAAALLALFGPLTLVVAALAALPVDR
ncbi:hypothetical protein [Streptomyces sp. NRAIS3]